MRIRQTISDLLLITKSYLKGGMRWGFVLA
jgi:hypothetical protein